VKRALTLEEQKDIARWAWSYVETSKHFREFIRWARTAFVGRRPSFLILLIQRNEPGSARVSRVGFGSRRNNLPRSPQKRDAFANTRDACATQNMHFTGGTRDTNSCDALNSQINVSELTPVLAPVPATTHAPAE
jgi:hypothetical protein